MIVSNTDWGETMTGRSITRRTALGGTALGLGAAALGGFDAMAQAAPRKTFVLVHGAWHGGWCWRRVADQLEAKGHKVFTPTLTGLGERAHLMSKDVDLDTHITDLVNVFKFEDLKDVCLVAHSYGGWPASGALEQVHDRVSAIVWLDAFKPDDGQKGADYSSEFSRKLMQEAIAKGESSRPAPPAATFFVNEKDQAWVNSKTTPQPNGVAFTPIKLTGARDRIAKKTYIRAAKYPQPTFDKAFAACKADPSWKTFEATSGHDVMVDAPDWLTGILLQVS
jgi:pimeloyl-ACP methyl ester carboxylesterase